MIVDILTPENFVTSDTNEPMVNEFVVAITNDTSNDRNIKVVCKIAYGKAWVNFCWNPHRTGTFQGGDAWGYFHKYDYQYGKSIYPICIHDLTAKNYFDEYGVIPKITSLSPDDWWYKDFTHETTVRAGETIYVTFTFDATWDNVPPGRIIAILAMVNDGTSKYYAEKYVEVKKCTGKTYISDMRITNIDTVKRTIDVEFDVVSDCGQTHIFNFVMKHPTKGWLGALYQIVYPKLDIGLNTLSFHYRDSDWSIQTMKDALNMGGADITFGVTINWVSCEQAQQRGNTGEWICKTIRIEPQQPPQIPKPDITVVDFTSTPTIPSPGSEITISATVRNNGDSGSDTIYLIDKVNMQILSYKTVSLNSGASTTVTFKITAPSMPSISLCVASSNDLTKSGGVLT